MKTAIPGLLAVVLLGTMAAASAYTLEGEVFAFETGPIPNASVNSGCSWSLGRAIPTGGNMVP